MYPYPHELSAPGWHWAIMIYFFAAGIAIGSYIFAAFGQLLGSRAERDYSISGYLLGMPLMIVSGLMLILDLHVPDKFIRFFHMMFNPRDGVLMFKPVSVMSLGSWAILLFSAISALSFIYAVIRMKNLAAKNPLIRLLINLHEGPGRNIYLPIGILAAGYIGTYTGILLTATQWPVWSATSLIPVLFLASGISTGLAAIVLMKSKKAQEAKDYIHKLEKADTIVMVIELILIVLFIISLGPLAEILVTGSNSILLFGGVVLAGLILPLIFRYKPSLMGDRQRLILSNILILAGGLALRYVLVIGAQHL
ncbi:NrfD/PsrC family molybdoenzyme membrane anchor subunit [Ferviditalea candida]|uniref:NrfD/PsrC family molybdoenzyme membrane anchor subunit n=1 Tax=Ferviditalea candida TaxID=3108399 RepID=A0ABU5ZGM9_9BACL|nr:NrfD/PsrC family molybdoenzyme membrane anchor subunit [Paenibacillaceae bacterium T2]